ncbi:MAG: transcription termination/antitermination NusG family protein [bacterium]
MDDSDLGKRMPDEARIPWHVLHVKPRCEKKLAAQVGGRMGLPVFLPLREETKLYQRRKVMVRKPVFSGYLFAAFTKEQQVEVLKTNQVVRVLEVLDQSGFLAQLEQVRKALEVDPTLGACEAFHSGQRVRVRAGPFQGIEGVVHVVRGQARVVLNIELIGQAVPLEVDASVLEVLA